MKKFLLQLSAVFLSAALCLSTCAAARTQTPIVQVGLVYGSGALTAANLQNSSGHGAGYRFGYFDEDLEFVELGRTGKKVEKLTMLRTSEIYYSGAQYTDQKPSGNYQTIGCYHVVLDYCDDFEEASELAEEYDGGFVAWIDDEYQVRQGAYPTAAEAKEAMQELDGDAVKGTSVYAVNVVETGDTQILFQFDGGSKTALGIMPDVTGADEVHTWFKGYRYQGGFRYERIGGGDLTVVNIVDMETYIKGVIPYEMNNNWPLEALKAQAVCARSYAYNCIQERSHTASNFDICNTEDCQVYRGVGAGNTNYQANERTDRAVEETAGMYALYNGTPIMAYYSSSHGGASERIDLVQNSTLSKFPYICGVIDPYEKNVAHLNSYSSWTKTWTRDELTRRLQERGYALNTKVKSIELTYSANGNVVQARVLFENGKSQVFTPKMNWGVRSLFGVSSLHFTINDVGVGSSADTSASGSGAAVNESGRLDLSETLYVLDGSGKTSKLDLDGAYALSGSGKAVALDVATEQETDDVDSDTPLNTVVTITGDKYVVKGAGNGHQMGMSQYGAYAMAEAGFEYDEIIEFYYPGTRVRAL